MFFHGRGLEAQIDNIVYHRSGILQHALFSSK
jgi:hypothetical protein